MRIRRGFTLIEVLVALAIAAIGLAAVLSVVTNSARNASYLRDKTLASWIGQNHLTEVRVSGTMPSVDKTNGELDFAGQKWKWEQTVTQTDVPGMRRIDVAVRLSDQPAESPIANVTGFVGRTQLAAPTSGSSWELPTAAAPGAGTPTTTAPTTAPAPSGPLQPGTGGSTK